MCFSASASFIAGGSLSAIGVATLKKARRRRYAHVAHRAAVQALEVALQRRRIERVETTGVQGRPSYRQTSTGILLCVSTRRRQKRSSGPRLPPS